jgi:hypothetical protein
MTLRVDRAESENFILSLHHFFEVNFESAQLRFVFVEHVVFVLNLKSNRTTKFSMMLRKSKVLSHSMIERCFK